MNYPTDFSLDRGLLLQKPSLLPATTTGGTRHKSPLGLKVPTQMSLFPVVLSVTLASVPLGGQRAPEAAPGLFPVAAHYTAAHPGPLWIFREGTSVLWGPKLKGLSLSRAMGSFSS